MILVFGGAYSGKLEFVKEKYKISNEEIFYCSGNKIDFTKKVISGIHIFTYSSIETDMSSLQYIKDNLYLMKDKIIICDEISSGIVPLKKEERAWREENGRLLQCLAKESSNVIRIFCGIPTIIK